MIPTFDQFLRPILALATKGLITRRSIQPLLTEQFKLTEAEVLQRVPSGSATLLANRSGWALSYECHTKRPGSAPFSEAFTAGIETVVQGQVILIRGYLTTPWVTKVGE